MVGPIARQQFDIFDRQKQFGVGRIVQLKAIMRRARHFEGLQADEPADAMLDMDHEIAAGQAGDFRNEVVQLAARLARPHQAVP